MIREHAAQQGIGDRRAPPSRRSRLNARDVSRVSVSRLHSLVPDLADKLEQAPPDMLRQMSFDACALAARQAIPAGALDQALCALRHGVEAERWLAEVAVLVRQWDEQYFILQESGAAELEWDPYFRAARAGSALEFALRGFLLDAIYESVHSLLGIYDLVETLRAKLVITG